MSKGQIPAKVYRHDDHLDIELDVNLLPFAAILGEHLFAIIKVSNLRGIRLDGRVGIAITKVNYKRMPKECPVCGTDMDCSENQSLWNCKNPHCKLEHMKFTETKGEPK